jgi:hypothetical protein
MIGKNHPSTLMEAQERACEMDENLISSYHKDEGSLEKVIQINQVTSLIASPSNLFYVTKAYLHKERREIANKVASQITGFVKKVEDPKPKNVSPLVEEKLESERTLTMQKED